jgi:hypothetical protein
MPRPFLAEHMDQERILVDPICRVKIFCYNTISVSCSGLVELLCEAAAPRSFSLPCQCSRLALKTRSSLNSCVRLGYTVTIMLAKTGTGEV